MYVEIKKKHLYLCFHKCWQLVSGDLLHNLVLLPLFLIRIKCINITLRFQDM